jgi:hypothetical protein
MFVVVTIAAIGAWQFKEWQRGNEWVAIGTIERLARYSIGIKDDLGTRGIECNFKGSPGHAIFVHRRDSKRARGILSNPKIANRYRVYLFNEDYDAD